MREDEIGFDDPNEPSDETAAPAQNPWTADDEQQARAYYTDYIAKNNLQNSGTVDDAFKYYTGQRTNGKNHADALTGSLQELGWQQTPDGTPGPVEPPVSPYQPPTTGGVAPPSTSGTPTDLSAYLTNWQTQVQPDKNIADQRTSLLGRLGSLADRYSQPVSGDDPDIHNQTHSYQGNVDRSLGQFREMAAERAHAQGIPTGAFDAQIGNATMAAGRDVGDFEGQLMHDEMLSRREALMSTLKASAGLLSDQDQMDLQNRIAAIDASLKSRGLDLQDKGLDIQERLGAGSIGVQGAAVNNQNNQFYDKFAYDQSKDANNTDSLLLQYLLNGR